MIRYSVLFRQAKIKHLICLLCLLFSFKASASDVGAPNIDFSKGDFSGWTMETGIFYRKPDSTVAYEWQTVEAQTNDRFHLINSAISTDDPIVSCDDLKENPFSDGAITMRIGAPGYGVGAEGDKTDNAAAERATYTFVVTEESKALILNFACVLHDPTIASSAKPGGHAGGGGAAGGGPGGGGAAGGGPGAAGGGPGGGGPDKKPAPQQNTGAEHMGDQIPHFGFEVDFKSPDGNIATESCAKFESTANASATYLKQPSDCAYSMQSSSLTEYAYLPWTSTIYDLTDKVGYEVTITFQTHDCLRVVNGSEGAGGHEAYGYFYAETTDLKLEVNNCESSGGNATIKAPKGFAHYDWRVDGNESPMFLFTGQDSSEVEIDRRLMTSNSKYTCTMRGELESCSSITLETELVPVSVTPKMSYSVGPPPIPAHPPARQAQHSRAGQPSLTAHR